MSINGLTIQITAPIAERPKLLRLRIIDEHGNVVQDRPLAGGDTRPISSKEWRQIYPQQEGPMSIAPTRKTVNVEAAKAAAQASYTPAAKNWRK